MKTQLVAALAILAAGSAPSFAQDKPAAKASQADVQNLAGSIKADKVKFGSFCEFSKLELEAQAAAEKKDEKALAALDKKMEEAAKKLGADFEKVTSSEMEEASSAVLEDLAKSCK